MCGSFGIFNIGRHYCHHPSNIESQGFIQFDKVYLNHTMTRQIALFNMFFFSHSIDKIFNGKICISIDCKHGIWLTWRKHTYQIFHKVCSLFLEKKFFRFIQFQKMQIIFQLLKINF